MKIQDFSAHQSPVMVRLPNWIGDACMCLPALDLLRQVKVPIVVCARGWAKNLLSGLNTEGFLEMSDSIRMNVHTLKKWRREHPSHQKAILLPDSLSSALTFRLAGFKTIGWRDDGRSLLLTWPQNKPQQPLHAVESWFELTQRALNIWGYETNSFSLPHSLSLPITNEHKQSASAALREAGLKAGRFVLIAPTATGKHKGQNKVWPHFDALTRVLQNNRVDVAMCPPLTEQSAANRAAPTADLIRPLDLGAYCALTQMAQLVVCNDSGVAHLCAASGAKQVTLFGVTDATRTGPWTQNSCNMGQNGHWPTEGEVLTRVQQLLSPKI